MLRKLIITLLLMFGTVSFADRYTGPTKPVIPSDTTPISMTMADCVKGSEEASGVTAADAPEEIAKAASVLCALRSQHKAARDRLLAGLAKLVTFYKDQTNHDHAANLPTTIKAIQNVVGQCLSALKSQQYCHNFQCSEEPERNLTLCETKAAEILDAINPP